MTKFIKASSFGILFIGIIYFQAIRLPQISDKAIFRGSYGEAIYSDWADSIRKTGPFWGYYNEGILRHGFTTYIPVASFVNYFICPDRAACEPMVVARATSLILSLVGLFFLYLALIFLGVSKNISLTCVFLVSSLPIYSWTCMMFYNEPYGFFFMSAMAAGYGYFLSENKKCNKTELTLLFLGFIFLGLVKPTNLVPFLFLSPLAFRKATSSRLKIYIKTSIVATASVVFFIASQRLIYPNTEMHVSGERLVSTGTDIWIFNVVDFSGTLKDVVSNFRLDFGFLMILGALALLYFIKTLVFRGKKTTSLVTEGLLINLNYFGIYTIGSAFILLFFLDGLRVHNYYSLPMLVPLTILTGLTLQIFANWLNMRSSKKLEYEHILTIVIALVVLIFYKGNIKKALSSSGNPDIRLAMSFVEDRSMSTEDCYGFVGDIVAIPQYFLFPRCKIERAGNNFLDVFKLDLDSGRSITYFYEKRLLKLPQEIIDKTKNCEKVEFPSYRVISCDLGKQVKK